MCCKLIIDLDCVGFSKPHRQIVCISPRLEIANHDFCNVENIRSATRQWLETTQGREQIGNVVNALLGIQDQPSVPPVDVHSHDYAVLPVKRQITWQSTERLVVLSVTHDLYESHHSFITGQAV